MNSVPCKTEKPLITFGRRRSNSRRKSTWPACLSVTRTSMPTKRLHTVRINQEQNGSPGKMVSQEGHKPCMRLTFVPTAPTRVLALPIEQSLQSLKVDTCRMTACRRGLLPHWHIVCHCWTQLSAWEPGRWTLRCKVFSSNSLHFWHFCCNDSLFH